MHFTNFLGTAMTRHKKYIVFSEMSKRLKPKERCYSIFSVIFMIIAAWISAQPAIFLGEIVNKYIDNPQNINLIYFSTVLIGIFISREILIWFRKRLAELTATRLEREEYIKATEHILDIDLIDVGKQQSGALNYNINAGIEGFVKFYKIVFIEIAPVFVSSVIILLLVVKISLWTAGIFLFFFLLTIVLSVIQMKSQEGVRVSLLESKSKIAATVVELLAGISYVRAIGAEYKEKMLLRGQAEILRKTEMTHHTVMMSFDGIKQLVEAIGFVYVIWYGFYLADMKQISIGTILTLSVLYISFMQPVKEMHRFIDEGSEASIRFLRLLNLYSIPTMKLCSSKKITENFTPGNALTVSKLSWMINGTKIINDISYDFTGKRVGLIGHNGSGKSTLIKLILGNYDNFIGSITMGGVSITDIAPKERWKYLTFVPQVPFVKRGTVRENLCYGILGKNIDDNIMEKVLIDVGLYDRFYTNNFGGLDFLLNESGSNLSGGEKQRLVLARELLKDNKIWILDEPTSALDPINERIFMDVVNSRSKNRTVLMIAHRLGTLQKFDTIIEMKSGKIIREAKYNEI